MQKFLVVFIYTGDILYSDSKKESARFHRRDIDIFIEKWSLRPVPLSQILMLFKC